MAIILWHDPDFPITAEHHEYWLALGRFIHRFAMMEQEFHRLLQLKANTSPEISLALFSGTRAKQAAELIDRIVESQGGAVDPDWKRAVEQFGIINGMRNQIIHHGALLYDSGFVVSNERRTIKRQHQIIPVSPADIERMTADLQTIAATIFVLKVLAEGGNPSDYTTDWREVGRAPWQYKSPSQGDAPKNLKVQHPRHAAPRSPSQE